MIKHSQIAIQHDLLSMYDVYEITYIDILHYRHY